MSAASSANAASDQRAAQPRRAYPGAAATAAPRRTARRRPGSARPRSTSCARAASRRAATNADEHDRDRDRPISHGPTAGSRAVEGRQAAPQPAPRRDVASYGCRRAMTRRRTKGTHGSRARPPRAARAARSGSPGGRCDRRRPRAARRPARAVSRPLAPRGRPSWRPRSTACQSSAALEHRHGARRRGPARGSRWRAGAGRRRPAVPPAAARAAAAAAVVAAGSRRRRWIAAADRRATRTSRQSAYSSTSVGSSLRRLAQLRGGVVALEHAVVDAVPRVISIGVRARAPRGRAAVPRAGPGRWSVASANSR